MYVFDDEIIFRNTSGEYQTSKLSKLCLTGKIGARYGSIRRSRSQDETDRDCSILSNSQAQISMSLHWSFAVRASSTKSDKRRVLLQKPIPAQQRNKFVAFYGKIYWKRRKMPFHRKQASKPWTPLRFENTDNYEYCQLYWLSLRFIPRAVWQAFHPTLRQIHKVHPRTRPKGGVEV